MKRIVFIIDNLSGGGAERIVLTLASMLNTLGHQGIIITLSAEIEHEISNDIQVINVPEPKRILGNLWRFHRHGNALQNRLQQLDKESPIDLVISNLPRTDRIVKYTHGFARYFCIHNTYSAEYINSKKGLSRWRKHQQLKRVYGNESVIAVSNGVSNDIRYALKLPIKQLKTIYNPFQPSEIQLLANKPAAINYGNYIIHVGRINRQKRHDRLLRAYKASNIASHTKLVLLGSGSKADLQTIKQSIFDMRLNEQVIIHGFDQNPFPYIKKAKALVLSSDFEGFGNVLVEALICGTPVVSTNCPSGPSEILTEDLAQYLVPTEDENALAKKIFDVCANPPEINEQHYQRFSAEAITRQYLALLDE